MHQKKYYQMIIYSDLYINTKKYRLICSTKSSFFEKDIIYYWSKTPVYKTCSHAIGIAKIF